MAKVELDQRGWPKEIPITGLRLQRLVGTGNEFVIKKPVSLTRDKPFRPTQ